MLLADSYGARLLVAVGTHYSLVEFLDKGREGMASTFLTRLRVGSKLVDAKGVSRIYRSQVKGWHLALLVLSGVVALVTAMAMTDVGGALGSLLDGPPARPRVLDQGTLHVINFRYHIVSLMAVFLALAVGIAVGVSLSPSVDEGILTQAQQDRNQVTALRSELTRRDNLDTYRSTYDQRTAQLVLAGRLTDARVALVVMPDAPARSSPPWPTRSPRPAAGSSAR